MITGAEQCLDDYHYIRSKIDVVSEVFDREMNNFIDINLDTWAGRTIESYFTYVRSR